MGSEKLFSANGLTPAIRQCGYLTHEIIHVIHGSMQKIQILFPDPLIEALRKLARIEDRPVSEIVRRAVDRDVEQRSGLLQRGSLAASAFPVIDGGKLPVLLPSNSSSAARGKKTAPFTSVHRQQTVHKSIAFHFKDLKCFPKITII